jgi:hypothetical protein
MKMAAVLAALHFIDSVGVLAPQVGLEPTTLRLTVARSRCMPSYHQLTSLRKPQ